MSELRFRETLAGDLRDRFVEVAFSGPALDLGDAQGEASLGRVLARVARVTATRPVVMDQVHGARVALIGGDLPRRVPATDAMITREPGVALLARAADCVPVVLADPVAAVVGVAHAGRRGAVAGVVPATVRRMRQLGAAEVVAWIGPHICGACYEVPAGMREEVASALPKSWSETSWGTPALDLGAAVAAQLRREGCQVRQVGGCTREEPTLPSHRRDGSAAGRMAGLVWISR